ncbi:hypothetical protein Dred_0822 [Desulforamulus reducens MI-1]|uniref:Uncharacterized protein n=1 Tax=Desulforamulus reducens (strain ATCC BAA-1160 / DSM 100696 / MI-1) TaxID=349161 RepID=A4J2Q7_DESRM|nr:hypothetical protein [Desulforamulus reducens]ABO49360.1 hypothetical protein Dred_0822 [Desulforamulus reducens MI-1]
MKKYVSVLIIAIAYLLNNINIASADIITSTVSLKRTGVSAGDTAVSSYSRGMVAYIEHAQAAYFLYILNHKPYAIDNHPLHFSVADNNYINGTMTLEVRRNDINGPLEYVETKSFTGDKYYEYLYFDIPILNPFLASGERLYYVINNQTNCRLRYYFYPSNDWKVSIQLYDQINADILREASAAKNNADLARQYASWANGNAETAKNNILWGTDIGGKSLGATFDQAASANNYGYWSSGYLDGSKNGGKSLASTYDQANSASINASGAKTSADSAKASADLANTQATTAASRVWDTTENKSAVTIAKESRDKANTAVTQTFYNGKSAAEWAAIAATSGGDYIAPNLECSWQGGATITNASRQATLVVSVSDNVSAPANIARAYSLDGTTYTNFTGNTVTITFPTSPKYRTVYVRATDETGKQTVKTLNIFVQ